MFNHYVEQGIGKAIDFIIPYYHVQNNWNYCNAVTTTYKCDTGLPNEC